MSVIKNKIQKFFSFFGNKTSNETIKNAVNINNNNNNQLSIRNELFIFASTQKTPPSPIGRKHSVDESAPGSHSVPSLDGINSGPDQTRIRKRSNSCPV